MANSLQKGWDQRCRLQAEGRKLWDEGHKLRDESSKLWDEGHKLWEDAVAAAGLTMEWTNLDTCELSNGEVYYAT